MIPRCPLWFLSAAALAFTGLALAQERTEKQSFQAQEYGGAFTVALSADGTRLACGGVDKTVRVFDMKSGKELMVLKGHTFSVRSVAFSPDGKFLASGGHDGTAIIWDLATQKAVHEFRARDYCQTVAWTPDGKTLITASNGGLFDKPYGHIILWDVATEKEIRKIECKPPSFLVSTQDAKIAACSFSESPVRVYDLTTGKETAVLGEEKEDARNNVAISADGKVVLAALETKVKVWDVGGKKVLHTLKPEPGYRVVEAVALSPDGKVAAVFSVGFDAKEQKYRIDFWNAQTGKLLATAKGHTKEVVEMTFSRDGKTLASASRDNTVKLWDVPAGD